MPSNLFNQLPTIAGNGPGTAVDVSQYGSTKTITVHGTGARPEPFVLIEISNDVAGDQWSALATFRAPGVQSFQVACRWMRATVQNYRSGGAPGVEVGGVDDPA